MDMHVRGSVLDIKKRKKKQAFTALSEGGGLYKTIVVSDYVFTFLGLTGFCLYSFSSFFFLHKLMGVWVVSDHVFTC